MGYNSNIWSQQGPSSPSGFSNQENGSPVPNSNAKWQYSEVQTAFPQTPLSVNPNALKSIPGETWSTGADEPSNVSSSSTVSAGQTLNAVMQKFNPQETHDQVANIDSHEEAENTSGNLNAAVAGGFQCGKCSLKCQDTESFRDHVEQCFN